MCIVLCEKYILIVLLYRVNLLFTISVSSSIVFHTNRKFNLSFWMSTLPVLRHSRYRMAVRSRMQSQVKKKKLKKTLTNSAAEEAYRCNDLFPSCRMEQAAYFCILPVSVLYSVSPPLLSALVGLTFQSIAELLAWNFLPTIVSSNSVSLLPNIHLLSMPLSFCCTQKWVWSISRTLRRCSEKLNKESTHIQTALGNVSSTDCFQRKVQVNSYKFTFWDSIFKTSFEVATINFHWFAHLVWQRVERWMFFLIQSCTDPDSGLLLAT